VHPKSAASRGSFGYIFISASGQTNVMLTHPNSWREKDRSKKAVRIAIRQRETLPVVSVGLILLRGGAL
jgi:hypothetical protein